MRFIIDMPAEKKTVVIVKIHVGSLDNRCETRVRMSTRTQSTRSSGPWTTLSSVTPSRTSSTSKWALARQITRGGAGPKKWTWNARHWPSPRQSRAVTSSPKRPPHLPQAPWLCAVPTRTVPLFTRVMPNSCFVLPTSIEASIATRFRKQLKISTSHTATRTSWLGRRRGCIDQQAQHRH